MGGIVGGLFQANASKKAAAQQAATAQRDLDFQRETRDLIFERTDPFYQSGITAQNALNFEMGLGERPAINGTEYQGFQATPGFQFALDQGNNSVNALAGARGGLNSGRTLQDLSTFNMGMANQEYGNYLNRLTGLAGSGQNAAGMQANAATNAASGVSNALSGIGNAQSAGTIGAANGIAGGINNQLALWQYQRGTGGGGGLNLGGKLFGGNAWG